MFEARLTHPDDFYQALLDAHAGLSLAESHALNARLVLILANQVGDITQLRAALAAARHDGREDVGDRDCGDDQQLARDAAGTGTGANAAADAGDHARDHAGDRVRDRVSDGALEGTLRGPAP